MKKLTFAVIACAALMASCNGNKTNTAAATADSAAADTTAADSMVYEGTLPAADCDGIRYRVALANDTTMGFSLSETYLTEKPETTNYNGVAEKIEKDGKTYYKLGEGKDANLFVKVVDDSTLRVVGQDLAEAEAVKGMNYDLKLAK